MGKRLEIELTPESARRLILTADFAIRDEQTDARSQSLSLMSIAISLHLIATDLTPEPSMRDDLRRLNPLLRKIAALSFDGGSVDFDRAEIVNAQGLLGDSETDTEAGGRS